ncbi:T9SS C-terminal target domain-containing protein [Aquimarina sp. AD10]|uniref:T9SS type A sorting domain-containing protein n=1 Tax=Aquimarina sp. AD10 TaxID=1714849 RepID=UPI000E501864|nr:T9SS type A sorting domain-containing protein [Aquimarina sp. AD10]AXT61742.1 T9SS C-terminal target domain-containing protein [Aquimarina sp. AD10]RKN00907.1 T9SS C-terminal target domain-containing protein [Aquimarina sp. AD10]
MRNILLFFALSLLVFNSIFSQTRPNVTLKKFEKDTSETIKSIHFVDNEKIIVSRTFTNNGFKSKLDLNIEDFGITKLAAKYLSKEQKEAGRFNKHRFLSKVILTKEKLPYDTKLAHFFASWNKSYLERLSRKNKNSRTFLLEALRVLESNDLNIKKSILANFYYDLARISYVFKDDNGIINYYLKAIEHMPNRGYYYVNLGGKLVKLKEYDLALPYLNAAKTIYPGNHPFTHVSLAIMAYGKGEYKKALAYVNIAFTREKHLYTHGSRKGTRDLSIYALRGGIKLKLGYIEEAKKDLFEALRINSKSSSAHRFLGEVYGISNDKSKACEFLQKAEQLGYLKMSFSQDDLFPLIDQYCHNKIVKETTEIEPKIYPIPAKTEVFIKNLVDDNYTYEVYSYNNKLITASKLENNKIDISSLKSGLYILKILNENRAFVYRFVKEQ